MSRYTSRKSDTRNNPTLSKYLTLRTGLVLVPQVDGQDPPYAIVQASRRCPRDYPDQSPADLLWRTLGEIQPKPTGQEYCSDCGEWRLRAYFTPDASRPHGVCYICKQCRNDRERERRMVTAMEQGREVRRYYRPKAA